MPFFENGNCDHGTARDDQKKEGKSYDAEPFSPIGLMRKGRIEYNEKPYREKSDKVFLTKKEMKIKFPLLFQEASKNYVSSFFNEERQRESAPRIVFKSFLFILNFLSKIRIGR